MNRVKKPMKLLNTIRKVVDFGVFGFPIVVFYEDRYVEIFGSFNQAFRAFNSSPMASLQVAKVIAAMADDPVAAKASSQLEVGVQVLFNSL